MSFIFNLKGEVVAQKIAGDPLEISSSFTHSSVSTGFAEDQGTLTLG
jgi:hypothetical protein